eukprot:TRINITY_DN13390_c0_g1_i1.p1 TRINITY_DN13390_c0_g1~~TRINITY_DN13390_c0_g1_i1.p1  ORF type:complete len:1257 (-),score=335.29 TRINITY_DN13390_c0_g1_i1:47-3325(-)
MALTAMSFLLNEEAIPAVLGDVARALCHAQAQVRKKGVAVVGRILDIDENYLRDVKDYLLKCLCDVDPSVMAVTLNTYFKLVSKNPSAYKDIVSSLVSILKQVIEHALSRDFDYHRIPAPWIQIKCLQILGLLGSGDKASSEHMYEIIGETLRRADNGINPGHAIVYQCIQTITTIHPNPTLLSVAAENIARFLVSRDHNLKYLGLKALREITKINPALTVQHHKEVIDCLTNQDEAIQRKTLDLLFTMTNPQNVVAVADKLVEKLRETTDKYLRADLVQKLTQIAQDYAPDNEWFIKTMNKVFVYGGGLVEPKVAYNLIVLIAEGGTGGSDEDADMELRIYAVKSYFEILEKHVVLSDILTQVIAWLLGEYSYLIGRENDAIGVMCDLMDRQHDDEYVRVWIINALIKLVSQTQTYPTQVSLLVEKYRTSINVELQQRCMELHALSKDLPAMSNFFPIDASCWDINVDENLSFLDNWIERQVRVKLVPDTPYRSRVVRRPKPGGPVKIIYSYSNTSAGAPVVTSSIKESKSLFDLPQEKTYTSPAPVSTTAASSLSSLAPATNPFKSNGQWSTQGWSKAQLASAATKTSAPLFSTPESQQAPPPQASLFNSPAPQQSSLFNTPAPQSSLFSTPAPQQANTFSPPGSQQSSLYNAPELPKAQENRWEPNMSSSNSNPAPPQIDEAELDPLFAGHTASLASRGGRGGRGGRGVDAGRGRAAKAPVSSSSGGPSAPAKAAPPEPARSEPHPVVTSPPKTAPPQDFDPFAPSTSAPTPTPARSQNPVSSPAPTPIMSTPSADLNSIFGAPSPIPAFSSTPSFGLGLGGTFVSQLNPSGPVELSNFTENVVIQNYIKNAKYNNSMTKLFENETFRIASLKAYHKDYVVLALFSSNKTSQTITDVQYTFTPVPSLSFSLIPDEVHQNLSDTKAAIPSLPPQSTSVLAIRTDQTAFEYNLTAALTVSFKLSNTPQHIRVNLPFSPVDFIRPLELDLANYGKLWQTYLKEAKLAIPPGKISTPQAYVAFVEAANLKAISVRGMEIVSCGQAQRASGETEFILLYAKILPNQLVVALRTKDAKLTDSISTDLKNLFASQK